MAAGAVIYGISGDAVLRIRNTHEDLASRAAAGPVISGIFEDAVFEIGDTHGDSTSRSAKTLMVSGNRSRVCRFCRVLSVRWGSGSSGSRAARRFGTPGSQKRCTLEAQVARFACGTPILSHWTAKTRHIRDPGRPVCVRHAASVPLDRKGAAQWWSGGAGGAAGKPREQESEKNTSEMYT